MKVKIIGAACVLAASSAWMPAFAADLGGDCCADLEERIAELEATTARKGNRKVSLTVYGQVNETIYWWDDGRESNVYVGTNGFSSSRFGFKGSAKINSDVSAGYLIEIEVVSAQVNRTDDDDDDATTAVQLRHSAWYLKSKTLGKITVGQTSHATDDITASIGLGGTAPASQGNLNSAPGANLVFLGSRLDVAEVFSFLDSDRGNVVRYDSPAIAGFTLSASWGEDDMWDVALRYAGEFNGIKIAAGIGYHVERDVNGDAGYNLPTDLYGDRPDFDEVRGAISVLHTPTGLFADFIAVHREFDSAFYGDYDFWMLRGGIYQKFFPIGKTSIFGEYAEVNSSGEFIRDNNGALVDDGFRGVDGTSYGIGIVQKIDAAAMELYAGWRHFEADLTGVGGASISTDDIETVYTGARIKF